MTSGRAGGLLLGRPQRAEIAHKCAIWPGHILRLKSGMSNTTLVLVGNKLLR